VVVTWGTGRIACATEDEIQESRPREHRRDADNAQDAGATREKAKAPAGGLRYERRTAKADPSLCSG
jgi:hypothetical protein